MDHERMRRLHGGKGGTIEKISHDIRLLSRVEIARDTWLFRFTKPEGFSYRAGQHVRMTLPAPFADPDDFRFWSFASTPYEPDLAFAVRMGASAFKTALAALPVGGQVRIDMLKHPPRQAFALDDGAAPVVFLTGGIGVVPAYAMIRQAVHDGSPRRLTLLYCSRSRADAPFLDELAAIAAAHDGFRFVPTLAQPEMSDAWTGETGRISLAMLRRHVPDTKTPVFYVSGRKGMVDALGAVLARIGVRKTSIRSEAFGPFTVAAVKHRSPFGVWSATGVGLIALLAAAHLVPAWMILKGQAVSLGIAGVVAAIVAVKLGIFIVLRRRS